jgi:hypothetical protein
VNGNPSLGIAGSIPPASAFEFPMREIVNLITKGGHVPDDGDLYQLTRSTRRALFSWATDTGSANSLSTALDPPLISYEQGLEVRILVAADNTSACTIRINGLSTQQIIKKDGSTLVPGDLKRGGVAVMVYDGANFQLVSGAAGSTTITGGWFNGADYMVDVGTPNHIVGTPVVVPTSYSAGQGFLVLVGNTNTGACDINVAGLGVRPLVLPTGESLENGDIIPGMLIRVNYDGSKFSMLSPINMAIIDKTVTKIVGPNAGADFVDLNVAMAWANRRKIDDSGWLMLQLQHQSTGAPLVHNYSTNIVLDHPHGDRIYILGGPMNFIPALPNATGGPIRSMTPLNMTYLRTAFQCEIHFTTAGFGLAIKHSIGLMQNLLVTGAGYDATPAAMGIYLTDGASLFIDTVASCMFNACCWWIDAGSALRGRNFYSVGSTQYCVLEQGATMIIADVNTGPGEFPTQVPLSTGPGHFEICDNLSMGIVVQYGASLIVSLTAGHYPRICDCSTNGLQVNQCASAVIGGLYCSYCQGGAGIIVLAGSTAALSGGFSTYANYGYLSQLGSSIDASYSTTGGIIYADYEAAYGSFILATGAQGAQFSPTINTVGNGNAMISG